MTRRQLEYFLTSARNLSFTRTAEEHYISQSAVTQQIRSLEQELDAALFIRKNNRLTLTPAGKVFVREAEGVISRMDDAVKRVRETANGVTGTLRIGYLKSMEKGKLPQTVRNFTRKNPGSKLELNRDDAISLKKDYIEGRYDVIFNIDHESSYYPDTIVRELEHFPMYILLPAEHHLARHDLIQQKDLTFEHLILHEYHQTDSVYRDVSSRKMLDDDLVGNITAYEDDFETIQILVSSGMGIAVIPAYEVNAAAKDLNLVSVPLETDGYEEIVRVYFNKNNTNPLLPVFMNMV